MIDNFTPQPYPLWLVAERVGIPAGHWVEAELVIGWREVDDEMRPVLANTMGTSTASLQQHGMVPHFFVDLDEACAMAKQCSRMGET